VPGRRNQEGDENRNDLRLTTWFCTVHQVHHNIVLEPSVDAYIPACKSIFETRTIECSENVYLADRVKVFGLVFCGRGVALAARNRVCLNRYKASNQLGILEPKNANSVDASNHKVLVSPLLRRNALWSSKFFNYDVLKEHQVHV